MRRRKRMLDGLDEDIRDHLERETQENIERGMSPEEARYAARRKFGNVTQAKEETREVWSIVWLEQLIADIRFGLRMLRKSPGFATVAILTLALGIGANTAMFAVVNAVLLRPLPYRNAEQLVQLWTTIPAFNYSGPGQLCDPDYILWTKQNKAFSDIAAFDQQTSNFTGLGDPEQLKGAEVTGSLFSTLDVAPALGRIFSAEEEKTAAPVVLLSDKLWKERFGSDSHAMGKAITLDGKSYTAIGVMPAGFQFPNESDFWLPHAMVGDCKNTDVGVIARIAPGVKLNGARADVARLAEAMQVAHNGRTNGMLVSIVPLKAVMVSNVRTLLLILLAGVALVVLIACANVASMLLARGTTRQREIAVRRALGAGRRRLVFQMLTESLLLASLGGGLAVMIAAWSRKIILTLIPAQLGAPNTVTSAGPLEMDAHVLLFAALLSIATSLVFGLAPAFQAARVMPGGYLKSSGPTASSGVRVGNLRDILVVAEMALTIVLLISAGLTLKNFVRIAHINPGFDPKNLLTFNVTLPDTKYPTPASMDKFHEALLAHLRDLPGTMSVATTLGLPMGEPGISGDLMVEGQPVPRGFIVSKLVVSTDYFRTMEIPLRMGREFDERDSAQAAPVLIVSQSFAEQIWPNENPIGKHVNPGFSDSPFYSVAGVVSDVSQYGLSRKAPPAIYMPYSQALKTFLMEFMTVVIRTSVSPTSLARAAQEAVESVDPDLPIFEVGSMEQLVYKSKAEPRFNSTLLGCFAGLALVLAAVGIYGVIAYSVSQRTNEIGIRMALGAERQQVLKLILGHGVKLTLAGIAIGLLAALAATRVLASYLFGITTTDPAVFAGFTLLLVCVALTACYAPARRAMRVDPTVALRHE
ncbi:MAG: ABC transporter permease [Candidatus Acidiferrum sp.]